MTFQNPYKRLKELKEKLEPLEAEERVLRREGAIKELKEVENKIFWIAIELIPIEQTIKYFEKQQRRYKHG